MMIQNFTVVILIFLLFISISNNRNRCDGTNTNTKSASNFFQSATKNIASLNDRILMENAERLGNMEKDLIGKKLGYVNKLLKIPLKAVTSSTAGVKKLLLRDGVVSISSILDSSLCDQLFPLVKQVEEEAVIDIENSIADINDRFGKVNNRRKRADLFLPSSNAIIQAALKEALRNLKPLLLSLDDMESEGVLHELSCIVSDGLSPRQCELASAISADKILLDYWTTDTIITTILLQILPLLKYSFYYLLLTLLLSLLFLGLHCDTPYLNKVKPLYTFFVALQDVEDDMGHTTFLPGTMTEEVHNIFNSGEKQKNNLIAMSPAFRSNLKKGDVVIFDSRLLHCGGANESNDKRRILFYFTLTAADTSYIKPGSIRNIDRGKYKVSDLL